ncbi:MAG TPA: DMT family transporter [Methylibium sp.]|uniref:DMT family transporter n=1 Tax=Methylibium sp. TaxID=2067992 RepID=UPI002DBD7D57|nr:DMT family transporter [Methylibium sp.]HEU4458842.1 DMT family transporter [Methylibium sp.]
MPLTAVALVLLAALGHALWNLAAKHAGGDQRFVLLTALIIAAIWAPVGVWAGWDEVPRWGALEWGVIAASAVTHVAYFTVLLRGYRASDLTVVYPVARGSGPLVSAIGALWLLDERLGALGALGIAAMALGVFLLAGGPTLVAALRGGAARAAIPAEARAARQRVRLGIGYGLVTGIAIAGYTLIDGYAVKVLLISPLLVDYFGNLLRIPISLPFALRDPAATFAAWKAHWRWALVVAVLSPTSYVLVLYAMTLAPLSHVAPLREVSMLFAAMLGGRLLGEGDRAARFAGAACIALGVTGLALG